MIFSRTASLMHRHAVVEEGEKEDDDDDDDDERGRASDTGTGSLLGMRHTGDVNSDTARDRTTDTPGSSVGDYFGGAAGGNVAAQLMDLMGGANVFSESLEYEGDGPSGPPKRGKDQQAQAARMSSLDEEIGAVQVVEVEDGDSDGDEDQSSDNHAAGDNLDTDEERAPGMRMSESLGESRESVAPEVAHDHGIDAKRRDAAKPSAEPAKSSGVASSEVISATAGTNDDMDVPELPRAQLGTLDLRYQHDDAPVEAAFQTYRLSHAPGMAALGAGFLVVTMLWITLERLAAGAYLQSLLLCAPVLVLNIVHGVLRAGRFPCLQRAWIRVLRAVGSLQCCPCTCCGLCARSSDIHGDELPQSEEDRSATDSQSPTPTDALTGNWIAWACIMSVTWAMDIDRVLGALTGSPYGSRIRDFGDAISGETTHAFGLASSCLLVAMVGGYCFSLPFTAQLASVADIGLRFIIMMLVRREGGYVASILWTVVMLVLHVAILYQDEMAARQDYYVRYIAEQGQKATANMLHAMLPEQVTKMMLKRSGVETSSTRLLTMGSGGLADMLEAADDESWVHFLARTAGLLAVWQTSYDAAAWMASWMVGEVGSGRRVHPGNEHLATNADKYDETGDETVVLAAVDDGDPKRGVSQAGQAGKDGARADSELLAIVSLSGATSSASSSSSSRGVVDDAPEGPSTHSKHSRVSISSATSQTDDASPAAAAAAPRGRLSVLQQLTCHQTQPVSLLQFDLVGFTNLSARLGPH